MLPNIVRLAQVLDIAPAELLPDDIAEVDATTRGRSVPALRRRLLSYRFVNPAFLAADVPPVTLPELVRAVESVWSAYQASRFSYVVAELHRLLPVAAATVEAQTGLARRQAEVQLAYVYQSQRACSQSSASNAPKTDSDQPPEPGRRVAVR